MLREVNQEFKVIWGDLQGSESQRHPCHGCSRAVLSCPGAGVHFIPCPLALWLPAALGMLWDNSREGFHALEHPEHPAPSPPPAPGHTHDAAAPALPRGSPHAPPLLHVLFLKVPPQAEAVGSSKGLEAPSQSLNRLEELSVPGDGAAGSSAEPCSSWTRCPAHPSTSWEHLAGFCGCWMGSGSPG